MTHLLGARAVRGSLWLLLVNVITKGSQIALTIVLAAVLDKGELGAVALVVSLVNIGQVIQSMGVYDVISRTGGDPRVMAGTLLTLSVGAGVALAGVLALAAGPLANALGTPAAAPLIRLGALTLPFTAAGGVQMGVMHRHLDFRRRLLPDGGAAVIGSAVTVLLAVHGLGARAFVIGLLCTAIAQPVLGAVAGVRPRPGWDPRAAAEALRWIAVVGPATLVATLLISVDYLVIGHVLGADAVGVYSLAYRIAWVPYILVAVVLGGVAFPLCAELVRTGLRDGLAAANSRFTRATVVITGGLFTVAAVLADRVVLLGERWAPAAPVLMVLCGYGLAIGLLHLWQQVLRADGHPRLYLGLQVAHLVLLVAVLLVCTRYGVLAVAIVQLGVAWLMVVLTWWALVRRGLAFRHAELARMAAAVVVAVAGCAAVAHLLDGPGWHTLAGTLAAAVAVLGVYTVITCLADRETLRSVREVGGRGC